MVAMSYSELMVAMSYSELMVAMSYSELMVAIAVVQAQVSKLLLFCFHVAPNDLRLTTEFEMFWD
jgi:hypothetical protein